MKYDNHLLLHLLVFLNLNFFLVFQPHRLLLNNLLDLDQILVMYMFLMM
jgi:hypothetical protein